MSYDQKAKGGEQQKTGQLFGYHSRVVTGPILLASIIK